MKTDTKIFVALLMLIFLVAALIFITVDRRNDIESRLRDFQQQLEKRPQYRTKIVKGEKPIEGVDYFVRDPKEPKDPQLPIAYSPPRDGQNAVSTNTIQQVPIDNYQLALKDGFQGTLHDWLESLKVKGDKGNPADDIDWQCIDNKVSKKRLSDAFWQPTNIKCEYADE